MEAVRFSGVMHIITQRQGEVLMDERSLVNAGNLAGTSFGNRVFFRRLRHADE